MQRTLREHISLLEEKISLLKKELESPGKTSIEKTEIEIDLGIAERALLHFQKAFVLEHKLSETVRKFGGNENQS